jgi:nuclear receptor subfamily 1 group I
MNLYIECSKEISFEIKCDTKSNPSRTDILNLFFTAIQRFALFAQRFESFTCISIQDKQILLRDGVLELCFLRGAFLYNMKGKYWQYEDESSSVFYSDHLEIMVAKTLLEKHMNFIKTLKKLHLDETTNILLALIVLLSPDREGLIDSQLVQKEQEKYLLLLKSYMNWRYGTNKSSILYPKLLLKLTDLRELAEAHTDYHLLLGKEELEEIQQRLSTLHIGITSGITKIHTKICCDLKLVTTSSTSPWNITKSLVGKGLTAGSLYADEELSTSSEGSDKLSSD